jgi:hypothetical protein
MDRRLAACLAPRKGAACFCHVVISAFPLAVLSNQLQTVDPATNGGAGS